MIVGLALVWLASEWVRVRVPSVRDALQRAVPVYRATESQRISGAGWLWIGYAVAVWFPPSAATAGVLVAAVADPAASIVGTRVSPGTGKTTAGSVAFGLVALAILAALGTAMLSAIAAAMAGAAVERWSGRWNDNLLISPTVAAVVAVLA